MRTQVNTTQRKKKATNQQKINQKSDKDHMQRGLLRRDLVGDCI
jgi:hypothetical protein